MTAIVQTSALSISSRGRALIHNLDLVVRASERLGVFGPSGAGKSTLGKLLAGLLEGADGRQVTGSARVLGNDALSPDGARSLHGRVLFVPQQAATSLPPHLTIAGFVEVLQRSGIAERADQRLCELLPLLGFHDGERVLASRPGSLSGGEKQRLAIGLGMLREPHPTLIILDEPTASLDPETKRRTADIVLEFQRTTGVALILISHDRWLLQRLEAPLLRIQDGRGDFVDRQSLMSGIGGLTADAATETDKVPLFSLEGVEVLASRGKHVLRDVNLSVARGDRLVVTGSSGAGKTTLLKLLTGHLRPTSGLVSYREHDGVPLKQLIGPRRSIQPIYQDARSSFDPRLPLRHSIALAMHPHNNGRISAKIDEAASELWLSSDVLDRLPANVSGGECQRAALLRAMLAEPAVLVADEPTANLDPDACTAVQKILISMTAKDGRTLIASSHDERFINAVASRRVILVAGEMRQTS